MYTAVRLPSPPALNVSDEPPPDRIKLARTALDNDQSNSSYLSLAVTDGNETR
jgi:hypothetical protein